FGQLSLELNTDVHDNVAVGTVALFENKSGCANFAIGTVAFYNNRSTGNVAVGYSSGNNNINGYDITVVGNQADASLDGIHNATAIGAFALVDASDKVRIGNTSVTS